MIHSEENDKFEIEDGVLVKYKGNDEAVVIPQGVTRIDHCAFMDNLSVVSVTIPDTVTGIYPSAFSGCRKLTHVHIPDSVTHIWHEAFFECSALREITIPDSVTTIGESAFMNCDGLTSVYIPKSVTQIWDYAFTGCRNLTGITVDSDNPNYAGHDGILYDKEKTEIQYVPYSISGEITMPDSATCIGWNVFKNRRKLTGITIPRGVKSIGGWAFEGCELLTSITYGGTKAQWAAIEKLYDWNKNTGEYTVTCTDGVLSKSESEQ